jgi:Cytochrome P450.
MYELAHHPDDQTRIREEIAAKRAKFNNGQKDFNVTDLDALQFTNAAIKVDHIHRQVVDVC